MQIIIGTILITIIFILTDNNVLDALGVHRKGQLTLRGRGTSAVEGRWG